jgi:hypothetical protein
MLHAFFMLNEAKNFRQLGCGSDADTLHVTILDDLAREVLLDVHVLGTFQPPSWR